MHTARIIVQFLWPARAETIPRHQSSATCCREWEIHGSHSGRHVPSRRST